MPDVDILRDIELYITKEGILEFEGKEWYKWGRL